MAKQKKDETLGIDPRAWGPPTWIVLDGFPVFLPFVLTQERRLLGKELFELFADLIPCGGCEVHFKAFMAAHPWTRYWAASPVRAAMWLNMARNAINKAQGKPKFDFPSHQKRVAKITLKEWVHATFTMLYYLMEYEQLKRQRLFDFLHLFIDVLIDARSPPLVQKMGKALKQEVGSAHLILTCKTRCLQAKLHTAELKIKSTTDAFTDRIAKLQSALIH